MDKDTYLRTINFLEHIKLVQGPTGLSSTLRRHKDLHKMILEFQVQYLQDLEKSLDILES